MHKLFIYSFKAIRNTQYYVIPFYSTIFLKIYLWLNGVKFQSVQCFGIPYIHVSLNGNMQIGENFKMNNGVTSCESGYNAKCRIDVRNNAKLTIGNSVGMSAVTISCFEKITILENVLLGVGVHIYDTDFHSLDPILRKNIKTDIENRKTKPIVIERNVFIGAHSIILKGVSIGENSIIGAGSVVSKSIPANVIAAGNPCKIIREI